MGEGVITLPVIYALKQSDELRRLIESMSGETEADRMAKTSRILELVEAHGGIDRAAAMLDKLIDRGLSMLETLPDNEYGGAFRKLISGLRMEKRMQ